MRKLDRLDVKLASTIGLVSIPRTNHRFRLLGSGEEFDRLLEKVADDAVEDHVDYGRS